MVLTDKLNVVYGEKPSEKLQNVFLGLETPFIPQIDPKYIGLATEVSSSCIIAADVCVKNNEINFNDDLYNNNIFYMDLPSDWLLQNPAFGISNIQNDTTVVLGKPEKSFSVLPEEKMYLLGINDSSTYLVGTDIRVQNMAPIALGIKINAGGTAKVISLNKKFPLYIYERKFPNQAIKL